MLGGESVLKDITILSLATTTAYTRGCRDYKENLVRDLHGEEGVLPTYAGIVDNEGQESSHVTVRLSRDGSSVESYVCDCPSAAVHLEACHHVVAFLKALQEMQKEGEPAGKTDRRSSGKRGGQVDYSAGERMFRIFDRTEPEKHVPQLLRLEPYLFFQERYYQRIFWLEFRIEEQRSYIMRNLREFMLCVETGESMYFGKSLTVDTGRMKFADERSQGLWQILSDAWRDEIGDGGYYYQMNSTVSFHQKQFRLTSSRLWKFFQIMGQQEFMFTYEGEPARPAKVLRENPRLRIGVEDHGGAGRIRLLGDPLRSMDKECRILYGDGVFYLLEKDFAKEAGLVLNAFAKGESVYVEGASMPRFFSGIMPRLQRVAEVDVAETFQQRFLIEPLQAEFYLDYFGDGLAVRPLFRYGENAFNPVAREEPMATGGRILIRDVSLEKDLMNCFDTCDFQVRQGRLIQEDEEKCYDFLTEFLPEISRKADVYYADSFEKKPVRTVPKITAGVSVNDMNLLEVTFNAKDIDFEELMDILRDYRQKRRYHRMKDGTFVTLEDQQLSALADFVETAGIRKGMADGERKVQLSLSHAMYLDELAREDESLRLERSKRFRAMVRDIRHPADSDVEVPEELRGILRDYQVTGFSWLCALAGCGMGGILADDMGLGKTLQVIAFLMNCRDAEKPPSLVVTPTSLMYNWMDEIRRFAPELRAVVIAGSRPEREAALENIREGTDVVITTYNLLKRDVGLYQEKEFRYCFLDEAQHIKNPMTQNARSVKKLQTAGYFALTGTPIENTLTELWSIFDFLMPGYLGNHAKFRQRYEVPIVRGKDEHAIKDLRRHVMPFILRRMKKDVLQELPDKVESRRMSEMTPEQAKIYRAYFFKSQKEFAMALEESGFSGAHIKILAILTRLRQIACDPSLFLEDYDGGSGKLDMLEEVVAEAISGGHRMLVFSQFAGMLKNIVKRLESQGVDYFYLDGRTPAAERIRLVKEFNGGDVPVFLISLKAGGTGLNLTGADMVIHYDPWWNPAVEDQATDRAYRIGQQKNVQVLKFIAKDTVEEKIYQLQEKKKSLVDQMIRPGETFLSKLTEEEIRDLFRETP